MRHAVLRVVQQVAEWHSQHSMVAPQALQENLNRLPWILGALLPLFGAGAFLALGGRLGADAQTAYFAQWVGWLDLAMMALLSFLIGLIHLKNDSLPATRLGRLLPLLLAVVFISFGLTLSILSQQVLPSATMYVLSCVFVGTLLLIRPSWMAVVYGSSYLVFCLVIGLTVSTLHVAVVMRFHGGIAAALGMCLSLVLWRRHTVTELLRRQVEAQSLALEEKNAELRQQQLLLENLAQHDALTGLLNRRAFEVQADMALQRARRDGVGIAALMLDLDFFKRVNDRYGHPVGDRVIKFMADVLRGCVRDTDLVARVGGEEFMVLLPGTSVAAAVEVAEKIRLRVAQASVRVSPDRVVLMTVSVGVAEFLAGHVAAFDALYLAADQALYHAKRRGRNRTEVSPALAHPVPDSAAGYRHRKPDGP